jgi:hypothetical protein
MNVACELAARLCCGDHMLLQPSRIKGPARGCSASGSPLMQPPLLAYTPSGVMYCRGEKEAAAGRHQRRLRSATGVQQQAQPVPQQPTHMSESTVVTLLSTSTAKQSCARAQAARPSSTIAANSFVEAMVAMVTLKRMAGSVGEPQGGLETVIRALEAKQSTEQSLSCITPHSTTSDVRAPNAASKHPF